LQLYQQKLPTTKVMSVKYLEVANKLKESGKLTEAIASYNRAIEQLPNDYILYSHLGEALASIGHLDEAIVTYRHATKLSPNSYKLYRQVGETFARLAAQLTPESWQSYPQLAKILPALAQTDSDAPKTYYLSDEAFLQATAHLSDEAFLAELSLTYLQRPLLDEEGKKSGLAHLSNGTLTRQQFPSLMRQSGEFAELLVSSIESLCLTQAAAAYRRAIELSPNCSELYSLLGDVLTKLCRLDEATVAYRRAIELSPNCSELYSLLGDVLAQLDQLDEAAAAYGRAIELSPHSSAIYSLLGDTLAQLGQTDEAIAAYRRTIELSANFDGFFSELGEKLAQHGKGYEAVAAYKQAVQVQPDSEPAHVWAGSYYNLGIFLAERGLLEEALICFQQAPQIPQSAGNIYENIWKGLNQLAPLESELSYYPTQINQTEVYEYFSKTCQYTVISIDALTEANKVFLSEAGLSLANLEVIRQDNLALEEIYINSFVSNEKINLSRQVGNKQKKNDVWDGVIKGNFQQSLVETGYIYLLCPITGKILRSNQSFSLHYPHRVAGGVWHPIHIYRFVSSEIFYLTVCSWLGNKSFIYFPNRELIIKLAEERYVAEEQVINMFKCDTVSYWPQVRADLSSGFKKKEVVVDLGFFPNLGHYMWNDLPGIQKLSENGILHKVDKFLIGPFEYLTFSDIFPDIPAEKIVQVADSWSLFKTIADNNYFALWTTEAVITEQLADRIYKGSLKKCSQSFLQEVEIAKKHFPLLSFQIRIHDRVWLSQVEGIANIINSLYQDFPNLGVLFEGWSRQENEEHQMKNPGDQYYCENMIEAEKEVVEKILALLNYDVSTYNTIGSMVYETIVWEHAIDMFVAPGGSGVTFVSWIANKPGVIHGNRAACSQRMQDLWIGSRENIVPPVYMSLNYIVDDEKSTPYNTKDNYDCPWEPIYQEVLKILKELSKEG
jgi:tetratricopeptide (TPR) repeat protein